MYACMHARTHACMHACIHTYIYIYIYKIDGSLRFAINLDPCWGCVGYLGALVWSGVVWGCVGV